MLIETPTQGGCTRSGKVTMWSAVFIMALASAVSANAEDAFRLLIVRDAADVRAQSDCVRGQLFLVRSFSAEDIDRRVRIADTLEVLRTQRGLTSPALVDGKYVGSVEVSETRGWSIALDGSAQLRAHKHGDIDEPSIFLGRRAGKTNGACQLAGSRLEDGEVMTRRLQRLINWREADGAIEVVVRSQS